MSTELADTTGIAAAPPPHAQLIQLTVGTLVAQAVSVVARLGVADALAGGPKDASQIATEVGADPTTLYRLLRAVADYGVLDQVGESRFGLTPLGNLLRSDVPGSLRGWATMMGMPFHRDAWTDLYASVRTGEPAFARVHGAPLFEYLADHADDAAVFDQAMTSMALAMQAGILEAYDFSGFSTVVDVGGGRGALLAAILHTHPHLRGVLFDTPAVVPEGASLLKAQGLMDRCQVIEGDFLSSVPAGGDLYLLSNILHDWDDTVAVRILKACRLAMGTGRVLILEMVVPDEGFSPQAKMTDLEMLVVTQGRQRTRAEFERLLNEAELRITALVPSLLGQPTSYVEAARG